MKIIDWPVYYDLTAYDECIKNQIEHISNIEGVISIYQIGGVNDLGISDLDFVIIFQDNYEVYSNPFKRNNLSDKYILCHNPYGAGESLFEKSLMFSFYHNYKHIFGKKFEIYNKLKPKLQQKIKTQLALEFLLRMYINLTIQKKYNIIKLRSLLLHIKGIVYDFEFLSYFPTETSSLIDEGMHFRKHWFNNMFDEKIIINWFTRLYDNFEIMLGNLLQEKNIYFEQEKFISSKNISINKSNILSNTKKGFVFNFPLPISENNKFKLNNRLNSFVFHVPFSLKPDNIISEYFKFQKETFRYTKQFLPHYLPMVSSLIQKK
jgi:hypothetical protein